MPRLAVVAAIGDLVDSDDVILLGTVRTPSPAELGSTRYR